MMTNHQDTKAPSFTPITSSMDLMGKYIVDCAFQVHKTLGPGLLESIYEEAFSYELKERNINFEIQKPISIQYKTYKLNTLYRPDMVVENSIIVELKSIDKLTSLHDAQILTYMKLMNLRLGYLINFNVPLIKEGIRRKVL